MSSLSPLDDYPVHQTAEPIRRVATSDRNFYDRYYFNCYPADTTDLFLIVGMGQYPNLGVADGFAVLRRGDDHLVVRASRALGTDRTDTTVGPLRIEVLEGLRRLRVVLEPGHAETADLSFDLTFDGVVPATEETPQRLRRLERVVMDTSRFVQTGRWAGTLTVDGRTRQVDPGTWLGNRDRSWGVRPVGEPEPPGRTAHEGMPGFFWIYSVMQFDDDTIVTIVQEDDHGRRLVEEAVRIRPGAEPEWLGRPEHRLVFAPGTRNVTGATLTFHRPGCEAVTVECELLVPNLLGIGTGYGLEQDWRHGMWQGELVVQALRRDVREIDPALLMFCPTDHLARFRIAGSDTVGTGLFEVAVIGPHRQYGFTGFADPHPAHDNDRATSDQ
ncbi:MULTISPECIES: hypothetical protein [Rhodococcus]|uniref:hypothetical protein n=1 Tax=Rhodococcus TaxID=1827 RepID=UPI000C9B08A9|nr:MULTISPECIES: hypothetical protein [Rhodococcus]PND53208.1 hypothetical protein CQZ88_04530 [Rhodococcus sp. ENV425]USC14640.1 hypothetical protein KZJ41_23980 [Rhodococcus sp. 11-3]WKW97982.1 hypothetical protein Q3O43_23625 [Rhodococcus aetherivorans]